MNELLVPPEIQAQAKACEEAWKRKTGMTRYSGWGIPSFESWQKAQDENLGLPPAPPLLLPWQACDADWHTSNSDMPRRHAVPGHAIVISHRMDLPPPQSQALERAAKAQGLVDRLLEGNELLSEYPWYRELDIVHDIEVRTFDPCHSWLRSEPQSWPWQPFPERPSKILCRLKLRNGDGKESLVDLPTDLAYLWENEHDLKGALPMVSKESTLRVDELVRIFKMAYFEGINEDDAEKITGFANLHEFEDAALHLATRILVSDEEASRRTLARIVERGIPQILRPGKALRIEIVDHIDEDDPLVVVQERPPEEETGPPPAPKQETPFR